MTVHKRMEVADSRKCQKREIAIKTHRMLVTIISYIQFLQLLVSCTSYDLRKLLIISVMEIRIIVAVRDIFSI